ncbi:MAG: curli production assembly protein CsgG [Acidobacteriaceae bacterium]|nr:curli production assembly protein CsgG [Acidobacteriaceae bacterium]MBV9499288.1 curli production assembly protein CsgG [Acidobacteriaceae bacterium]
MKHHAAIYLVSALLAMPLFSQQQPAKRRVAVLDFNYATVMTSVQAVFGTNQDIGKGISDLLVDQLLKDGNYRVIERNALDKVLKEQNFSNSDRADSTTAAKIGKVLGVDAIITGDITQFGRDDQNTGAGGALGHWDKYGIGKIGMHKAKAVVAVTARIIDVNTAEILASETGKGESQRSGTNLLGGGASGFTAGGGGVDMSSSNFSQTIIGEAVHGAVTDLGSKLSGDSGKMPTNVVPVNGLVADATGNQITINVGSKGGVHVGDTLVVSRVSRVIKDPATGKPLRTVEEPVGKIQITQVDDSSAVGTFSGAGQPKVGDAIKNQ